MPRCAVGRLETQESPWCSFNLSEGLRARRVDGVNSNPKIRSPQTQGEPMFQFEKRPRFQLNNQAGGLCPSSWEHQLLCSLQAFEALDEADPHREGLLLCSVC